MESVFEFPNLDDDPRTRVYMLEELELDVSTGQLYPSRRLTNTGSHAWPGLLRETVERHEPGWLERQSQQSGYWLEREPTTTRSGQPSSRKVPPDAAQTLAEGQFMRYYLRAVARRAIDDGFALEVRRLKDVASPRSISVQLIGTRVDPAQLLDDLRRNQGIETFLDIPPGPNSGLGVVIVPN
ncbi:hypothetical protein VA596_43530 [Amycolatopsis sp., V23-08]|uniref:Uncharacterized protein n=1 Tax=Amycolatopsis heterodermiae TaxID=3110235 RepID=A0ABU5RJL1_9PSEU|nr:hypothetical protein [Amycolatopsis sp., V23-08]MEA5366465.1 hypothetical protein [Amycolatopsis sp., V23-08]